MRLALISLLMFTALQGVARAEEPVAVEEAVADPAPQPVPEATTPVEQPVPKATTAIEVELTNGIIVKGTVLTTGVALPIPSTTPKGWSVHKYDH